MTFTMIFLAVLCANSLTISYIAVWLIYQRKRRIKAFRAEFDIAMDGFERLIDDLQKDEHEVRH